MKKMIIFFLLLLLLPNLASAELLNLEQCLNRALAVNPQVKASRMAIDEAQEGIYEARGAFLPTLSVKVGHTQLTNNGKEERNSDYLSQKSDSFTIRLSQPLFTGMAGMAGLSRAQKTRSYREFEYQNIRQQLALKVRLSFYDILKSQHLVSKWKESVGRLESQQKIARAWVEQELAPRLRQLEVDDEHSKALQQLASAESALAVAEANLKEWLAFPADDPLQIEGSLQHSTFASCATAEICLQQALEQRPELQLAKLNVAMAREDVKSIRARNLPQISLDAGWIDYQRKYDVSSLPEDDRNYYTLSLNLSMRPFQGGKNIFAYRKQKLTIKRLEYVQSQKINAIGTEVNTRYQQLLEGDSRLRAANMGVVKALEAYHFADRAIKVGASSLDDLLSAEIRLTQAEINKINADYALQKARDQLEYAVGTQLSQF